VRVIQARSFKHAVKRLHANQKKELDDAIRAVMELPAIGERRTGDLARYRIHKFRLVNQLTLLAYTYDDQADLLTLEALGSHENFYRDLKQN
jgi:mRNA-degrading endonuclease YafQ of YafQ-DinJ toxin-antitoxin module